MSNTGIIEFLQQGVQFHRIRGGQTAIFQTPRRFNSCGSNARRCIAGCLPDLAGKSYDRSFSGSSRNRYNCLWLPWIKRGCNHRQHEARIIQLRHQHFTIATLNTAMGYDGRSTGRNCLRDKVGAICLVAAKTDKQPARFHLA